MIREVCSYHIKHWRFALYTVRQSTAYQLLIFVFLVGFAVVALSTSSTSRAAQSQQHSWVGDIPIMEDLSVEPALGFAFDSPKGRIVMIFASSTANASEIFGFYNESLPAIGWVGSDGEWRRGSETLFISEVTTTTGQFWRLLVRPN